MNKKVLIISASDSDLEKMQEATQILDEFGVENELTISSAHRSADRTAKLVTDFSAQGGKIIICGAGLAAHLAGVAAAHFPLPVIGIPLKIGTLQGLDALLATVQMPSGIPVATVGIDNAKNAAILAVQILAISDSDLAEKLIDYKKNLAEDVEKKSTQLDQLGVEKFLKQK